MERVRTRAWMPAACLLGALLAGSLAAEAELATGHLPGEARAVKVSEANGGTILFTAEARAAKTGDWALATRRHPVDPPLATSRFDAWPNGIPVPFVLRSDGRREVTLTLTLDAHRAAVTYPSRRTGEAGELFVSVRADGAGTRVSLAGLTLDGVAVKDAPAVTSTGPRAQDVLRIQGIPAGHGFTLAGTITLGWQGAPAPGSEPRVLFWGVKSGRQAAGAPQVTITEPAAESVLASGTPTISARFSGAPAVTLRLDGTDRTAEAQVTAGGLTFTPSTRLLEGKHTAQVLVRDPAGRENQARVSFTTDTVPPTIVFASPGPVTDNPAPVIRLSYSDATAGLDPRTLKVTLDGESIDSICVPNAASGVCLTESVAEGSHRLTATIRDRAGNLGTAAFGFTVEVPVEAPPE